MAINYGDYEQAIYRRVCRHCIDLGQDGKCTLPFDLKCGVQLYLPEIVAIVTTIHSENLDDYISGLRQRVCMNCKNQKPDGNCKLRDDADCGLNRYFELIVEAIEEVEELKKKEKKGN